MLKNRKSILLGIRTTHAYKAFCDFYKKHGTYPTYPELASAMVKSTGYCSAPSARKYLIELAKQGLVDYEKSRVHPYRLSKDKIDELVK